MVLIVARNTNDLKDRIIKLKQKRNALILAHNYETLDVQEVADFVGDSLQLAKQCMDTAGYDMIIFAGVGFMAEMAAVLSENTPVYIPDPTALCPLASWVDADKVRFAKQRYPDAPVVVYVNTTAETKNESDSICTSSNAVRVVESLGVNRVLFGPDKNLAEYVRRQTGIDIIDIEPLGHCCVHERFDPESIRELRKKHPNATIIAHPECRPAVQDEADIIGSTGKMAEIVANSELDEFIIVTELGLVEQLQAAHPHKVIIPADKNAICKSMKKLTLEKILRVLEEQPDECLVTVPPHMVSHIKLILERMNGTPVMASAEVAQTSS